MKHKYNRNALLVIDLKKLYQTYNGVLEYAHIIKETEDGEFYDLINCRNKLALLDNQNAKVLTCYKEYNKIIYELQPDFHVDNIEIIKFKLTEKEIDAGLIKEIKE